MVEGWKALEFDSIIKKILDFRGKTPKKIGLEWGNGEIKALSANNVKMGYIDFSRECYLASNHLYDKWMNKGDCEKHDILFTMEAPLGNVALVPNNEKYILSQRVILIKTKEDYENKYIYQYMTSDYFQLQLKQYESGTTAKGIQQSKLVELKFNLPKEKKEQQKIADILSSVDSTIESTSKIISKQKRIKTALMQDLLTNGIDKNGKIRNEQTHQYKDSPLDRIPVEWDTIELSQIKQLITKGTTPTSVGFNFTESGVNFIKAESITKNGQFIKELFAHISNEADEKLKRSSLKENDILFSIAGVLGRTAIVTSQILPANTNQALAIVRLKEDVDIQYLYYALNSYQIYKQIEAINVQNAQANLSLENINNLSVVYPKSGTEQKKIAQILSKQDEAIEQEEKKLAKLQRIKTALMQDLLSGKVRVKYE